MNTFDKDSGTRSQKNTAKIGTSSLFSDEQQEQEYNQEQEHEILTDTNVSVRQTEAVRLAVNDSIELKPLIEDFTYC